MNWGRRQRAPAATPPSLPPGLPPWLLAAALGTAAPHFLHQPLWLSALAGLIFAWRGWIWHRQLPLPPHWLLLLVSLGGASAIVSEYHTLFGRDAGVSLLMLFLPLKMMELRHRRDGVVVLMLGYFLLLTHYFYAQDILTGLWMLLALLLLTTALLRLHGGHSVSPPASLRYAGTLLLQALPFMLVMYLLFPRIAGPLWGLPKDAHGGMGGLSDTMAPGSLADLSQSGDIAFRVQFDGPIPPRALLYWRGPVMDELIDDTWRTRPFPHQSPLVQTEGPSIAYTSTLEPHDQRWLLALDSPITLPPSAEQSYALQVLSPTPVTARNRYAFRSSLHYRYNPQERQSILRRSLELPTHGNPRTRALARQWQAADSQPAHLIQKALTYFRQEAFFYTLHPPPLGADGVDQLLFGTHRGFCEHYASAFVVLMRAAGVPARVVTGYQGGEINPVDGYLTVRQSDAHAWAEVWIETQGWLRVDPTAAISPARVESGIAAALGEGESLPVLARIDLKWLVGLRNRWDAANNAWNQWVLGYTPERQRQFLAHLGLRNPNWRSLGIALGTSIGLLLALLTLWSLRGSSRQTPEERLWQRFCHRMARQLPFLARMDWEGPQAYATRIAQHAPGYAPLAREISGLYVTLRYGPPLPPRERQRLLQRFATTLRQWPSRRLP